MDFYLCIIMRERRGREMSKNPCGLDYCPYAELIGEFASCVACPWANYEEEKDGEESEAEE